MDNDIFSKIPDEETSARYRSVFCNPAGEFVLRHMAYSFGFYTSSYFPGDQPMDVATREGAKNFFRSILSRIGYDQIKFNSPPPVAQRDISWYNKAYEKIQKVFFKTR